MSVFLVKSEERDLPVIKWGRSTVPTTGLVDVLRGAAEDVKKARASHQFRAAFSVAEGRVLANKLSGKNTIPLSPKEKEFVSEALCALSEDRDTYKDIALTDTLTGLANLKGFTEALEREFSRLDVHKGKKRIPDAEVAILYMDLDGFKAINDTFGHQAGDKMLREFAERMGAVLRKTDTLARTGGDEFCCVLPYGANDEPLPSYELMRHKIDEALAGLVLWDGDVPYPLGTSIGFCTSQEDLSHIKMNSLQEAMVECADQKMYLDKLGDDESIHPSRYPKHQRLSALAEKAVEERPTQAATYDLDVG